MYNNWYDLKSDCGTCRKCPLGETRTNLVFGVGNENAEVMLIGEGPGEQEDLQGEPFVGKSGQLLDKYLAAIDLDRNKNVYIANIVKCRPPHNRDPKPEEQDACISWLKEQTRLIHPKRIFNDGHIPPCGTAEKSKPKAGRIRGLFGTERKNKRNVRKYILKNGAGCH